MESDKPLNEAVEQAPQNRLIRPRVAAEDWMKQSGIKSVSMSRAPVLTFRCMDMKPLSGPWNASSTSGLFVTRQVATSKVLMTW